MYELYDVIMGDMLLKQFLKTYCHQKLYTKEKVLTFSFSVNQNISHIGFLKALIINLTLK